jgi:L-ascorbate metabolism protein UlaG (beta-lactamase superfamily)
MGGLGMMSKVLVLYLKNKDERVPKQPLPHFRTDARVYEQEPASGLRVTWMGHSSTLVEMDGVRVLIDPMWDLRASPSGLVGPKRFFPTPLVPEELPKIDVVLLSHDHYDHLGTQTIRKLVQVNATKESRWVTSLGVGTQLRKLGVRAERTTELDWTDDVTVTSERTGAQLKITALPARHFSGRSLWNRFETLWSSFAIRGQKHKIYFGGDSGLWDGFAQIAAEYGPFDLTMLEVGAHNKLWEGIHMGPDGAARAFQAMGAAGLLMPIHWGLFELAPEGWRHPIQKINQLADECRFKLWSPEPGVPTEVMAGEEVRSDWWSETAGYSGDGRPAKM